MDRDKRRRSGSDRRIGGLLSFPGDMLRYLVRKWKGRTLSKRMANHAHPLPVKGPLVDELLAAWSTMAPNDPAPLAAQMEASLPLGSLPPALTPPFGGVTAEERAVVARIREQTVRMNRNNVTRTAAYLAFYRRYPEVHWAFLAHMVSRNGGWNMTDLQGELLPRLLNGRQCESTFRFLERANALIFGDAYPQLLLYEAGTASGRDLSHLLRYFGVSRFMEPVWCQFRRSRDPVLLTIALIVNEQHFIERRVVQHPYYRKEVLQTAFFGMQSLLQLNQVLFPYSPGKEMKLSGIILEDFNDLHERIEFGKRLYAMLFGVPEVQRGAYAFACAAAHTGSRADYAPRLFTRVRHQPPQRKYRVRLDGCRLRPGAEPLYSPELAFAWPDRPVNPAEQGDWFISGSDVAVYFKDLPLPASFEMTNEYGFALGKIELAVLAKEKLGPIMPK